MKKKIFGICFSMLFVAMLALPIFLVYATKPSFLLEASNTFLPPPIEVIGRMEGESGNRHTYLVGNYLWTGDIEGNGIGVAWRLYTNWPTTNPVRSQMVSIIGTESEPATVWVNGDSYEGILTIRCQFIRDVNLIEKGTWVILDGTDELENLKGQGKILADATLSGLVHFDP